MPRILITFIVILYPQFCFASQPWIEGKWVVFETNLIQNQSDWVSARNLPKTIVFTRKNNRLVADVTLQDGRLCRDARTVELIEGYEWLMFGCPYPVKSGTVYSPLHRIKLSGREIRAIALSDVPLYSWAAKR